MIPKYLLRLKVEISNTSSYINIIFFLPNCHIILRMKDIPSVYIILFQCKPYILKPAIVTIDRSIVAVYHIKTGPKNTPRPAVRPT